MQYFTLCTYYFLKNYSNIFRKWEKNPLAADEFGLKLFDLLRFSIVCFSSRLRFSGIYTPILTSKSPLP